MQAEYLLFFFFVFSFLFRAFPRILFKKVNNTDTYFHLYLIDFLKENGSSEMIERERFARPFVIGYPWLLHRVISFFPRASFSYIERFFNPLFDSIFAVVFVLFGIQLGVDIPTLVLGGIIYLFTPLTFSNFGTGPRVTTFTPRLFGEVIGGCSFFCLYLYYFTGQVWYLVAAVALSSILYMTSKFSVQALVFINVSLSIVTFRLEPLLVIFLSFLLCMAYTKGFYLKLLHQHLGHLKVYLQEVLAGRVPISERNNFKILWDHIRSGNWKKAFIHLLIFNSYFAVIYKSPILVLAIYAMWFSFGSIGDYIFIAAGIVFLLTSLKWFLFIGEAERYLNYILFFPILSVLLSDLFSLWVYGVIIAYGALYYFVDIYVLYTKSSKFGGDQNDRFIDYLKGIKEKKNIATIPYHLGCWRVVYETQHNWWGPNVFPGNKEEEEKNKLYWVKYPFLNIETIGQFMSDYKLDCTYLDVSRYKEEVGEVNYPEGTVVEDIGDGIVMISNAPKN
ncbi:hypothetical protein KIH87_04800 [Paraneptunicella aestuarii]|uniref:hypothetical protein n=1 Tax=Paraneptunicella aestuarii TaxID=2831148 RepID=UPI001E2AB40C|nr:hypothetical protein [Paraneptunicella aestuarii]UAA39680.1 hypothetical protein KIH87_04800 [Paraneptunicella aestuarii]